MRTCFLDILGRFWRSLFDMHGRLGALGMAVRFLPILALSLLLLIPWRWANYKRAPDDYMRALEIAIPVLWCILAVSVIALAVRRLHDFGLSGWFVIWPASGLALMEFAPPSSLATAGRVLLFVSFAILCFVHGPETENQYGPPPGSTERPTETTPSMQGAGG